MRKYHTVFAIIALFITQQSFANTAASTNTDDMTVKQCEIIAKACLKAGYFKKSEGKAFWKDCMKPVLLGKTVSGVKIDAGDVSTCRQSKISKMQSELEQLQQVK